MKNKKMAVTIVTAILLTALYLLIFYFSEQNGEQSSGVSYKVSEKCVEVAEKVSGNIWSGEVKHRMALYFEHPVRKIAHFCEYACMGALVLLLLSQWMPKGKRRCFAAILWVFLSAALDEIHQLHVPDRNGSFADVLLDTAGGIFGLMLMSRLIRFFHKHKRNKSG